MTWRTKRRLAVLALALGLVAAAPYGFRFVVDGLSPCSIGTRRWTLHVKSDGFPAVIDRIIWISIEPFHARFLAARSHVRVDWAWGLTRPLDGGIELPPPPITLRVACAVALAGVWLLTVCIRALGRSRADTPDAQSKD